MTTRAFAHAPDTVAKSAHPDAAHEGEPGALSDAMHGPDAKPGPAAEILLATQELALHLVPAWTQGVSALAPPAVLASAGGIIAKWMTVDAAVQALQAEKAGALAPALVAGARSTLAPLARWQFRGEAVLGPPAPPMGADVVGWVRARADAVARCVGDARRAVEICQRAKQNGADWEFARDDAGTLGMILLGHADYAEAGFIWEVLHQHHLTAAAEALRGPLGDAAAANREARRTEMLRTKGWRDAAATAIDPKRLEEMKKDVGLLEGFVSEHITMAGIYLALLRKYEGHERVEIVRMLDARNLLHNMAHLANGDDVEEYVQGTEGWSGWKLDDNQVTERTQEERIGHALKEGIKNAPGGTLDMIGSFYDGLGDLPLIGGTMKRAGDAFHSLGAAVDEKIGVNPEFTAQRNFGTGIIMRAEGEILKFGVGGELKAAEAARAYQAVSTGTKVVSTAETIYDVINDLRSAWDAAKAGWALWSTTVSELSKLIQDALVDNWTSDPRLVQHVIDHASALFGAAIGVLGGKVKGHVTDAGRAAKAAQAGADERKEEKNKVIAEESASPQVKIETALLHQATQEMLTAKTDAERAQAQHDMAAHGQRLRELMTPASFKNAQLAESNLEREEKEWGDKTKAAKAEADGDPGLAADVKTLTHSLGEKLKEGIIDFGVAALGAAGKELADELKPYATPGAKPMGLDAKKIVATGVAKGASAVATTRITGFVRGAVRGLIMTGIDALAKKHPALAVATAFGEQVEELLKYIEEKLEVDEQIKKPIEEMILDMFGVEAPAPEGGAKKE